MSSPVPEGWRLSPVGSDTIWEVVAARLPVRDRRRGGRPLKFGHRLIIDTVLYVLVSGCAWRLVPHDLAPWDAAYRWYGSGAPGACGTTSTTRCAMRPRAQR